MFRTLLAATTALTMLVQPAAAFPVPTGSVQEGPQAIRPGQTVQGDLRRGDATLDSGEYTDTWTLRVRAGETYEVTLSLIHI